MVPLDYPANEGRVNPRGIPYLYLATDKETAMGEARPWVGSEISVAQFKLLKTVTIVDCSVSHSLGDPIYFNAESAEMYEPDEEEREKAVWTDIDKAFSRPVIVNENLAQYAPTQIIAELFKKNGGIRGQAQFQIPRKVGAGLDLCLHWETGDGAKGARLE